MTECLRGSERVGTKYLLAGAMSISSSEFFSTPYPASHFKCTCYLKSIIHQSDLLYIYGLLQIEMWNLSLKNFMYLDYLLYTQDTIFFFLRGSYRVRPYFWALFLTIDYEKTTNDFRTLFLWIFLFILELLTLFWLFIKITQVTHMSLIAPLSRKSRAAGVNDFNLSDNLKQKKDKRIIYYPLRYGEHTFF